MASKLINHIARTPAGERPAGEAPPRRPDPGAGPAK